MFSLSVFALMGLQIYMGVLTQKCIKNFPEDGSAGNLTDENWFKFCSNSCKYKQLIPLYDIFKLIIFAEHLFFIH